jgi:hypothetical protein
MTPLALPMDRRDRRRVRRIGAIGIRRQIIDHLYLA